MAVIKSSHRCHHNHQDLHMVLIRWTWSSWYCHQISILFKRCHQVIMGLSDVAECQVLQGCQACPATDQIPHIWFTMWTSTMWTSTMCASTMCASTMWVSTMWVSTIWASTMCASTMCASAMCYVVSLVNNSTFSSFFQDHSVLYDWSFTHCFISQTFYSSYS